MSWLRRILGRRRLGSDLELFRLRAEAFYRAGGILLLEDFVALSTDEQIALVEVYERVEADRLARLGLAVQSLAGAAEVAAPADGGLARSGLELARLMARVPAAPLEGEEGSA